MTNDPKGRALTVEQCAGVTAALAEGFDLGVVLAQEQITAEDWQSASAAWKERLVSGGPKGKLLNDFRKALVRAEDTLTRKVTPLDTDPTAWVGFLKLHSKGGGSDDLLRSLDLGPNDLSRLSRLWAGRARSDETVRKQLSSAAEAELPPLAGVQPAPRVLRRFPWSPAAPAAKPEPAASKPAAEPKPGDRPAETPAVQMPSFMRPGERLGPMVPLAALPSEPVPLSEPQSPPPPVPAPPAAHPLATTAHGAVMPIRASLPFQAGEAAASKEEPPPAAGAKKDGPWAGPPPGFGGNTDAPRTGAPTLGVVLGGTRLGIKIHGSLPLLKSNQDSASEPEAPEAAPPAPSSEAQSSRRHKTAPGVKPSNQPVLPFEKGNSAPPPSAATSPAAPAETSAKEPTAGRVSTGTSPVFKIPSSVALPFAKSTGAAGPAASEKAPPTNPAPSDKTPASPTSSDKAPPAQKALSLEQHAAMSLEATVLSRHLESVLRRYNIDAATKAELDAYYRTLLAENADARERWNRAYQAHYAKWQSSQKA